MGRLRSVAGSFFLLCLAVPGVAFAQGADGGSAAGSVQIALILAPLVAAAAAIERILEMVFDWIESVGGVLGRLLKLTGEYVDLVRRQVEDARKAVSSLLEKPEAEGSDAGKLEQAEQALADAEDRLVGYFQSPDYTAKKRAWSLLLGIVGGLAVAGSMQLGIVHLLLPAMKYPELFGLSLGWLDYVLTGFIIGTGSAPIHSLIGLLQNTKDAVGQARALMSGKAVSEVRGVLAELQEQTARQARGAEGQESSAEKTAAAAEPTARGAIFSTAAQPVEPPAPAAAPVSSLQVQRSVRRILGG